MDDLNAPDAHGVGPIPCNNPDGIRWSTNVGYSEPGAAPPEPDHSWELHGAQANIRRASVVTGVDVESGGERFIAGGGADCAQQRHHRQPAASDAVGRGTGRPPAGDGHTLSCMTCRAWGATSSDHPLIFIDASVQDHIPLDGLAPRLQVGLRYTATGSDRPNDMMMWMQSFASERINRGGSRMEATGIRITGSIYLAKSKGRISLTSLDPHVQPFLDYHLLEDPDDRRRLREVVRLAVDVFGHLDLASVVKERYSPTDADLESDDALDAWMLREVTTGQHLTTTCRMGPASDPMNVVDQYGRVHGIKGLRVADASVMPDTVRANTNVTTMMIGERIADYIRRGV